MNVSKFSKKTVYARIQQYFVVKSFKTILLIFYTYGTYIQSIKDLKIQDHELCKFTVWRKIILMQNI